MSLCSLFDGVLGLYDSSEGLCDSPGVLGAKWDAVLGFAVLFVGLTASVCPPDACATSLPLTFCLRHLVGGGPAGNSCNYHSVGFVGERTRAVFRRRETRERKTTVDAHAATNSSSTRT